jgi:hypothetical protein
VIPNSRKISVPAAAKLHSTAKQVQAARRAMHRRCCWSALAVMIKNAGTAAIGSTRKKVDVKELQNVRQGSRHRDYDPPGECIRILGSSGNIENF